MDLARAPCRAPLTARKMGSGYENAVGQNLSNQLPSSSFREYLKYPSPTNSFYFDAVTPLEVEMERLLLPTNKAHGLY